MNLLFNAFRAYELKLIITKYKAKFKEILKIQLLKISPTVIHDDI